jgi:hypothetical protein
MLNVPTRFVQGDTVTWRSFNLSGLDPLTGKQVDFLPSDYTLIWTFGGGDTFSVESVPDGDEFVTTIISSISNDLTPGQLYYQCSVQVDTGEKKQLATGSILVVGLADSPFDARTNAEQMLAAVDKAILDRLSGGAIQSYSIKGRNLAYMDLAGLKVLRDSLKAEVAREKAAESLNNGFGDPRQMFVRFGNAGGSGNFTR